MVESALERATVSLSFLPTKLSFGNMLLERPRACILVGIGLLFLLAGISVAAGICYINHIGKCKI